MPEGYLTTHVLDTARGCPAEGIQISLYRVTGNTHRKIADSVTNSDGRTDTPLLQGNGFKAGDYELIFDARSYFDQHGLAQEEIRFLSEIPIRFGLASAEEHYHVPLLLSPYGYSTYRGS